MCSPYRGVVPGILYVCSTPIGNLGDVSRRLAEVLAGVEVVYAEDTRRTAKLLNHLGVTVPLRSYFAGNEAARSSELGQRITAGSSVALVSDAGTPAISDPGLTAVTAALAAGGTVVPVPGPSAVTALLSASGLPSERFVFEGFLPRKGRIRRERLDEIAAETRTVVFFTTAQRILADLESLADAGIGDDRLVVVGRELTKLHEEVWRGSIEAALGAPFELRGEFTVALSGATSTPADLDEAVAAAHALVEGGSSVKDAAGEIAASTGLSRREIYERLIRRRD